MITFMHAADIHLDSPLRGLARYEGAPLELLRRAPRGAFTALIDEAVARKVRFVILAGDIFDGRWKDVNTGLFLVRQLSRLREAGIDVYMLWGNHDADCEVSRNLPTLPNVHVFPTSKPGTFTIPELKVALHGRSFKVAATEENLVASYPDPIDGWLNIGVLHTALEGHAEHARYAPCTLSELEARAYQYWALGHVHDFQVLRERPWVVFPGNIQGRHIKECGPKGAVAVTADDAGDIEIERVELDVLRWDSVVVDVGGAGGHADVMRSVRRALTSALERADGRPLAVRVTITGTVAIHAELKRAENRLRDDILAVAVGVSGDQLWVEKVRLDTRPPAESSPSQGSEAMAQVAQLLASASTAPDIASKVADDVSVLLSGLDAEVIQASPELAGLRDAEPAALRALMDGAAEDVVARLGVLS